MASAARMGPPAPLTHVLALWSRRGNIWRKQADVILLANPRRGG